MCLTFICNREKVNDKRSVNINEFGESEKIWGDNNNNGSVEKYWFPSYRETVNM